ncbi:MAG TPA: DUF6174 domain-containing protein [Gammaproteobacteria bacterium]|jgi:hypothetical protein
MIQKLEAYVRAALFAACALAAAQAPRAGAAAVDELQASWARWTAAGLASYEYGYNKYCECHRDTPPETVVVVADGAVERVYHLFGDSAREVPAREGSTDLYWTIDDLFRLIEGALERNATVRARYDAALGYPTAVYVDYDAEFIGDEIDVRLTRLERRTP